MFDISAIIINFNSEKYTKDCIDSLLKHTSPDLSCQYIIVDNGSERESYLALKKYINTIKNVSIELIRSNINTGFGSGNMIGVQKAVGVCGPQSFTHDKKILPTIDHFASLPKEILGRKFLEKINSKKYPNRKKLYKTPLQGQFVGGSFMFFRTEDFNTVGGFDTNIFLYYEETDICKRLLKIGKSAFLVPDAQFIHFHGASTNHSVAIKTELKISLLYVIRKHYGIIPFYILLTYLQIRYFFSALIKPKYWTLFYTLLVQAPLSRSLKHKQQINIIDS